MSKLGGHRNPAYYFLDHVLRLHAFQNIFEVQNDPVPQDIGRHRFHIVGNHKVSAVNERNAP